MNRVDIRKQYLKLTARLFEVASEFDEQALLEVAKFSDNSGNPAIRRAAYALLQLISEPKRQSYMEEGPRRSPVGSSDSLTEFFQSRELFPTTSDISMSLPFKLPVRQKESRDRYVKRLTGHISSLSSDDRQSFVEAIQKNISSKVGSGFVSNWSKLIRGL